MFSSTLARGSFTKLVYKQKPETYTVVVRCIWASVCSCMSRGPSGKIAPPTNAGPTEVKSRQGSGGETPDVTSHFSWMPGMLPAFGVPGNRVEILQEPADFYETLKDEASKAKKRIVLSSLYLGTGDLEQKLVDSIYESQKRHPSLRVQILLDFVRGSRGSKNSRTMLLPILQDFEDRCQVALYHTPDLRGIWKYIVPDKFNETIGVQHMKVYIFDDTVILSGANLSESYFTNRQDRYIMLRGVPHLAEYFQNLVDSISSVSFHLTPTDQVVLDPGLHIHPYQDNDDGSRFKALAKSYVEEAISPHQYKQYSFLPCSNHHDTLNTSNEKYQDIEQTLSHVGKKPSAKDSHDFPQSDNHTSELQSDTPTSELQSQTPIDITCTAEPEDSGVKLDFTPEQVDTWIFPSVQMGPFGITEDQEFTTSLFKHMPQGSTINLASGYFNLTDHYREVIIQQSSAVFNILTAEPRANGFYGASGLLGAIPDAYTFIARQFYQDVCSACQEDRISLQEFHRPGWTFHAKGLWGYLPATHHPVLTLIGSPNFGYRSICRDLEVQIAVVTSNPHLQRQLHQEQLNLYKCSTDVTAETFEQPHRHIPYWVTKVTDIIKNFF